MVDVLMKSVSRCVSIKTILVHPSFILLRSLFKPDFKLGISSRYWDGTAEAASSGSY